MKKNGWQHFTERERLQFHSWWKFFCFCSHRHLFYYFFPPTFIGIKHAPLLDFLCMLVFFYGFLIMNGCTKKNKKRKRKKAYVERFQFRFKWILTIELRFLVWAQIPMRWINRKNILLELRCKKCRWTFHSPIDFLSFQTKNAHLHSFYVLFLEISEITI